MKRGIKRIAVLCMTAMIAVQTLPVQAAQVSFDGNKKFRANWSINTYILQMDANDGRGVIENRSIQYKSGYGVLPVLDNADYDFLGWYDDPVGGQRVDQTTIMNASNTTIYAHWKLKEYTLKLAASNGYQIYGGGTYHKGDTVTITVSDGESEASFDYSMPGRNVTLNCNSVYSDKKYAKNGASGGTLGNGYEAVVDLNYQVSASGYYLAMMNCEGNVQYGQDYASAYSYLNVGGQINYVGGPNGYATSRFTYLTAGQQIISHYVGGSFSYQFTGSNRLNVLAVTEV